MNYLFCGKPLDVNIGNGKTLAAVEQVCNEHYGDGKVVFSNIKLKGIPFTPFTPDNIDEVLETENAIVLFDEIYTVLYKNHHISETCKKHRKIGLCYDFVRFFRQVRKNDITTVSTAQLFSDPQVQLRLMMQEIILCEKFHWVDNGRGSKNLVKCRMDKNRCPADHEHLIRKTNARTGEEVDIKHPEWYYGIYNSNEIVDERWCTYE